MMGGGHLSIPSEIYAEALRQDRDAEELYRIMEKEERPPWAANRETASVPVRTTDPQGPKE